MFVISLTVFLLGALLGLVALVCTRQAEAAGGPVSGVLLPTIGFISMGMIGAALVNALFMSTGVMMLF